jgi:hypothetical protein
MEQTEKDEGVHKANGTNGKTATGCILYQTRVLLQIKTVFLIPDVSKIRSFVLSGKLHGIWFFNGIVITAGARRE